MQFHPFEPIIFDDSKVLILGTFPSIRSFENNFYYAHPRNQFWNILSKVFNYDIDTREDKIKLLKKHKIALWDIIKECERVNSSDTNLNNITPNDIKGLLNSYPNIKYIAFTSKTAQKIYNHEFKDLNVKNFYLPSPSPAYARMSFDKKFEIYKNIFIDLSII